MSSLDNDLAELLGKNAQLFASYENWSNGQVMLLAGTVDDPDSFDADGGKIGPRGYYPVANASGQTMFVPSIARLKVLASAALPPVPRAISGAAQAYNGDVLTVAGSATVTVPAGDEWSFELRQRDIANPPDVMVVAGARADPDVSGFVGYAVRLYPVNATTIAVQPLGYIYEGVS